MPGLRLYGQRVSIALWLLFVFIQTQIESLERIKVSMWSRVFKMRVEAKKQ